MGVAEEAGVGADPELIHDLREGLTLTRGWIEVVLKHWEQLDEQRRKEILVGALYGANRLGFILDMLDGQDLDEIKSAHDRTADDFLRLAK